MKFRIRLPKQKPEHSLLLRVAVAVTVVVSLVALLHEELWPSWGKLVIAGTICGFWISWIQRSKRNFKIRVILAISMLVAGVEGLFAIVNAPYDPRIPLANLLIWLQMIHSFDMPSRLDLSYSLLVSLILMALAAIFSNSFIFGLYLILYLASVLFSLLLIAYREAFDRSEESSQFPHFSYSPRILFSILLRSEALLAIATLFIGFLFFLFFPRTKGFAIHITPIAIRLPKLPTFHGSVANPGYPVAPAPGSPLFILEKNYGTFNPQSYFGFNPFMDLRVRGELSDQIVMKVKSQEPGYWRGLAFDHYTGNGWAISSDKTDPLTLFDSSVSLGYADGNYPNSKEVIQSYYVTSRLPNLIFFLYEPSTVYFPSSAIYRDSYDSIRLPFYLDSGTVYTVISRVPRNVGFLLKRTSDNYPAMIRSRYLQLPSKLPQRVKELAKDITATADTPYEKVLALIDWLHQFPYTLDIPPPPPGRDAVDHFLFTLQKGYCEQFASAFAVLARSVGIPTRVVTGYATGTYNPFTLDYEVREKDAHAWDEVYFPRVGWIPFDASPPYAETPFQESRSSFIGIGIFLNYLNGVIKSHVPHGLLLAVGRLARVLRIVIPVLILFLFVYGIWNLTQFLARWLTRLPRRQKRIEDRIKKHLVKIYEQLERRLAKEGYARAPWETPLELAAKVPEGAEKEKIFSIMRTYLKARFSHSISEQMVEEVRELAKRVFP